MLLLRREEVEKRFKLLREQIDSYGISDEMRGWSYTKEPVKPLRKYLLSVSELSSRYCPTMRDIYLKRVVKVLPPPSFKMFRGIAYHAILSSTITAAKSLLYQNKKIGGWMLYELLLGLEDEIVSNSLNEASSKVYILKEDCLQLIPFLHKFYKYLALQISASLDLALSKFQHIDIDSLVLETLPSISEMKVDGSLVGLSRELSVDVYTPFNALIDLKTGDVRTFHKYNSAGYALAIEADKNIEVNFGITLYISIEPNAPTPHIKSDFFLIGDELRTEFLEIRDEASLLIEKRTDPGMPSKCPDYCPYYTYCNK